MASDAAVWRSACAVTRGNVGSACWQRATAPDSHESVDDGGARYPPVCDGHSRSSRPLPSTVRASASTTKPGSTTVRPLPDLRVPTHVCRPTVTALRCSSIRRRRKSISNTRSAAASPHLRPPTPNSSTRDRYRPDSSASRCNCSALRYTLRRRARLGSFTPRAGFDASIRSRTASSKIRAKTEYAVCTMTGPRLADNSATHACTSENRTSAMAIDDHRGATCTRHALS